MPDDPVHRTVMVIDAEASSGHTNPELGSLRRRMYEILRTALAEARLPVEPHVDDRGDGALLVVDAPALVVLDPLVERLITALKASNAAVDPVSWLRLRVALHTGPVHADDNGWSSDTINSTFAICNAKQVKDGLRRAERAQVVVAVSHLVHDQVVRHGYRSINPAGYRPVNVARIHERAWVRVPGYPVPPVAVEQETPTDDNGGHPRMAVPGANIGNLFLGGTVQAGTIHGVGRGSEG